MMRVHAVHSASVYTLWARLILFGMGQQWGAGNCALTVPVTGDWSVMVAVTGDWSVMVAVTGDWSVMVAVTGQ